MKKLDKMKLFLVDDDKLFLKALEIDFLNQSNFQVETYPTGEKCIENLEHMPDLIILDYHLDGIDKNAMNGITTLDAIKAKHPEIPVIMLSSQDKIEVAVNCLHHLALDYVVKSETSFMRLKTIIQTVFRLKKVEKELSWYMNKM